MRAGWLWEMRSAIEARVRDRNPMEVANDLGHRFGDYFRMAGNPSRIAASAAHQCTEKFWSSHARVTRYTSSERSACQARSPER